MTLTDIVVKHTHGDRAETKLESVLTPPRHMHFCDFETIKNVNMDIGTIGNRTM